MFRRFHFEKDGPEMWWGIIPFASLVLYLFENTSIRKINEQRSRSMICTGTTLLKIMIFIIWKHGLEASYLLFSMYRFKSTSFDCKFFWVYDCHKMFSVFQITANHQILTFHINMMNASTQNGIDRIYVHHSAKFIVISSFFLCFVFNRKSFNIKNNKLPHRQLRIRITSKCSCKIWIWALTFMSSSNTVGDSVGYSCFFHGPNRIILNCVEKVVCSCVLIYNQGAQLKPWQQTKLRQRVQTSMEKRCFCCLANFLCAWSICKPDDIN